MSNCILFKIFYPFSQTWLIIFTFFQDSDNTLFSPMLILANDIFLQNSNGILSTRSHLRTEFQTICVWLAAFSLKPMTVSVAHPAIVFLNTSILATFQFEYTLQNEQRNNNNNNNIKMLRCVFPTSKATARFFDATVNHKLYCYLFHYCCIIAKNYP